MQINDKLSSEYRKKNVILRKAVLKILGGLMSVH